MDYKGIAYLRNKLQKKRSRVNRRYKYYESKNSVQYLSKLMPAEYRWMSATLGWCGKAVDSLADRLSVSGIRNDDLDIWSIYRVNNSDVLFDSAMLSALVSSCCFLYVLDDEGTPRIQVIDGGNATGILDPITLLLTEGYAVLERDPETDAPRKEAYFTAEKTDFISADGIVSVKNPTGVPLLVPMIHRPDAKRGFGHSRITRACMSLQDEAVRTLIRSEVAGEYYSFPQKYILGLSEDAEFNGAAASMSSFLAFTKDEDGDRPSLGQFTQQSMAPHIDAVKALASLFAGESGLTLDDLGFSTSNPMSADAIKSAHESLRLTARKAQHTFGTGILNAGFVAACLRDRIPYKREAIAGTTVAWKPLFEPDTAQLSGIGDAILKLQQAFPDYLTREKLDDLLGF